MVKKKSKEKWEYGDFQTPQDLAEKAITALLRIKFLPKSILEPTCGTGAFLIAASKQIKSARKIIGLDINQGYLENIRSYKDHNFHIIQADFFNHDWMSLIDRLPEPILIVGNPPWVTSSDLGMLRSANLPLKSNFQRRRGFDAITGKSNFDISEWMILQYLQWLQSKRGVIAVLCKTAIARKILTYAWNNQIRIGQAKIFKINAIKHFDAAVDACFFVVDCINKSTKTNCEVYESLEDNLPSNIIGYHDALLISDVGAYEKNKIFIGHDAFYQWRSGIKHDCTKVMELKKDKTNFQNGYNELISLEDRFVYPLYKSSDISNGIMKFRKYVIVTQKKIGEDTDHIATEAPMTWKYLSNHAETLSKRASSIYKNRPPFSIFGVGDYTFSPWKVAISGFYKKLDFKILDPVNGKPVMVDDTVNFIPCYSREEAVFLVDILNSEISKETLNSMIFWDEKRPITIDLLKRLNIHAIARHFLREKEYDLHTTNNNALFKNQLSLFS